MLVKLRTNWFGPDGKFYSSVHNPHNMPESYRDKLPKSAKIEEVKAEKPAKE